MYRTLIPLVLLLVMLVLPGSVSAQTVSDALCTPLTLTLSRGSTDASSGGEVSRLQMLLAASPEIYPEGEVTGYFGPATERAVQQFQEVRGIVSSGTPATTGFGRVGPATRLALATGCRDLALTQAGTVLGTTTSATTTTATSTPRARPITMDVKGISAMAKTVLGGPMGSTTQHGSYEIRFEVTAKNGAIYIPATASTSGGRAGVRMAAFGPSSAQGYLVGTLTSSAPTATGEGGGTFYMVRKGTTEWFSLAATFAPTSASDRYGVRITEINYGTSASRPTERLSVTSRQSEFETQRVSLIAGLAPQRGTVSVYVNDEVEETERNVTEVQARALCTEVEEDNSDSYIRCVWAGKTLYEGAKQNTKPEILLFTATPDYVQVPTPYAETLGNRSILFWSTRNVTACTLYRRLPGFSDVRIGGLIPGYPTRAPLALSAVSTNGENGLAVEFLRATTDYRLSCFQSAEDGTRTDVEKIIRVKGS